MEIEDYIEKLETDDSDIGFGDYFLEVGDYRFIHELIENDGNYDEYLLPNGYWIVPLTKSDFDWNKKYTEYKRIVNLIDDNTLADKLIDASNKISDNRIGVANPISSNDESININDVYSFLDWMKDQPKDYMEENFYMI
jgi:hypothetical protein